MIDRADAGEQRERRRAHAEHVAVEQYDQAVRDVAKTGSRLTAMEAREQKRVSKTIIGAVSIHWRNRPPDTPRNPSGTWYASVAAWAAKRRANRAVTAPAVC
jgi:hypothetical protein